MDKIKPHDEDRVMAEQVRTAVSFTAHYHRGVMDKMTTRDLPTLDAALAEAERLEREFPSFGRKAMVYAVTPQGFTILCSKAIIELVRAAA